MWNEMEKLKTLAEIAHKDWMKQKYSEIIFGYINRTSQCELLIDTCIACYFIKDNSESKLRQQLTSELIHRLPFRNKFIVFKNILSRNYKSQYTKYHKELADMYDTYETRTKVAHSYLDDSIPEIKKLNKTRIPYRNMSKAFQQPLYISLSDFKRDMIKLDLVESALAHILVKVALKK